MAKSRKMKHSKRSTRRRAGAKAAAPKFASVADACRKILKARPRSAEKIYTDATAFFTEMSEEEQQALDLCFTATSTPELKEDAEAAIENIESTPTTTPETSRATTPSTLTLSAPESQDSMDIDREPGEPVLPIIKSEEVPMELDGGRKRRKSRKGGRKHKNTRRH